MVVIGHFGSNSVELEPRFDSLFVWIYAFHMPFFVFVSGLFSKSAVRGEKLKSYKVFYFASLCWILKLLFAGVNLLFSHPSGFRLLSMQATPWYMFAMAIWLALTYMLKSVKPALVLMISVVLALFVGCFEEVGDILAISKVIVFYPYFILGYYIDPVKFAGRIKKYKAAYAIAAGILVGFTLLCIFRIDLFSSVRICFTGRRNYLEFSGLWEGVWNRFLAYLLAAVVSLSLMVWIPDRKLIVSRWGTRTLQVYFFHRPILTILMYAGTREWMISVFGPEVWAVVWIVIAAALTCVLSLKPLGYFFTVYETLIRRIFENSSDQKQ